MFTQRMGTFRRSLAGFSIIELMIVLTIVGVLAGLAIPSFNNLIKDNRRASLVNELTFGVMLARAEAAKRGQPVTICGNTSGGGTSCTGGTNWDYGWMIFLDPDGDGAIASTNDVLRFYKNDYAKITVRSTITGGGTGHIVMKPFNQSGTAASLKVCDDRGATKARVVCVGSNGRSNSQSTDCTTNAALTVCP